MEPVTSIRVSLVDVYVLRPGGSGLECLVLRRSAAGRCPGSWEAVHGHIEVGETPADAAQRELEEETGIPPRLVERVTACPERLKYDLPVEVRSKLWGGKWRGQDQDWFLGRFLGSDADVNIATDHPEFREWKWIEPQQLPELIVPFKRDLYRRLLSEFAEYL